MKCSEHWLQEWVNLQLSKAKLSEKLTMSGLEVEEVLPVAPVLSKVMIGEILALVSHPTNKQLTICSVNTGKGDALQIVCGAPQLKIGMKVPVAVVGATLAGKRIEVSNIAGVQSNGMLCSADDLGLSIEKSTTLFELSQDAPVGTDLNDYLDLKDIVYTVAVTPNRGDCLSIKGMAREIAALTATPLHKHKVPAQKITSDTQFKVIVTAKAACPRYVCRTIRHLPNTAETPDWMKERLRRSGMRSISPIVDVTNYVMLELGQPMHAFDLKKVTDHIEVRLAQAGETIELLDDTQQTLTPETLVIADAKRPLAIAGIMGGVSSSVTLSTQDIILESAYFAKESIAQSRQHYLIHSESSFRFERGVDPTLQRAAIERATQLILEIAEGGEVGPIVEAEAPKYLPSAKEVILSHAKLTRLLGIDIPPAEVKNILERLGFLVKRLTAKGDTEWRVQVPTYRFDISLPEDLIEEVARVYGYDHIPYATIKGPLISSHEQSNTKNDHEFSCKRFFAQQDYNEVITYSFIPLHLHELIDKDHAPLKLFNPLSSEMAIMRASLVPGLINALLYNENRQQERVRLFEIGTCFQDQNPRPLETLKLGGIACGDAYPEQWGLPKRLVDFFDIKGDIDTLLNDLLGQVDYIHSDQSIYHPGFSADIIWQSKKIASLGALHPSIIQKCKLPVAAFVFELNLNALSDSKSRIIKEISKFPEIRRDIAILINRAIPAKQIQDTIRSVAGDWLKEIFIFDVYQGKGIPPDAKSIALALILQHPSRTLVDIEVTELLDHVIQALKGQFNAELRS